jgi:MFS family permease
VEKASNASIKTDPDKPLAGNVFTAPPLGGNGGRDDRNVYRRARSDRCRNGDADRYSLARRLNHYSWVFSAYLVTSTVTVPVWGKLSDLYGRRLLYQIGIAVFLLGTLLSGLSLR